MRLGRGAVLPYALAAWLCALAACGHQATGSLSGSAAPPHWPKAGPAPVIATMSYPLELVASGHHVWVVSGDRDVTILANGSARTVKTFGWVRAMAAADGDGVWVAADDVLGGKTSALWRIEVTGGATRIEDDVTYVMNAGAALLVWRANDVFVRDATGTERPLGVGLDKYGSVRVVGDRIYVASRDGLVARVPLAGGAFETIGDMGDLLESFDVAGSVIYATVDRGVYTMTIPPQGNGLGLVRHTLVENLDDPRELVADGKGGAYVLTYGTSDDLWGHSTNSDGELLHIDGAGHVTALASDFIGAGRIALTADKVYVSDVYGGRVLMLPR